MNDKIIFLKDYKHKIFNKNIKMFFLVIIIGAAIGFISWHILIERAEDSKINIPKSKNITYNNRKAISMTSSQVASQFEEYEGKPILLYIYTTWCRTCLKNMPIINEIIREFQDTELEVITLAIDRDLTPEQLKAHLDKFGNIYFQPQYLAFKDGFLSLLKDKGIQYNNRIPYTVLISRNSEVITKYSGSKNKKYLRNKIIKELF